VTERIAARPIDSLASQATRRTPRGAAARGARDLAARWRTCMGAARARRRLPRNVRLAGDGRAVLIDFGLAGPAVPGDGAARGTLGYAAPEALTGVRSAAVDLFALGATLFEAWSGAPPFGRGLPPSSAC
jgi:serine/threonine protein kinase